MAMNKVRKAEIEQIPYLAKNMRKVDVKEVWLSSNRCPESALSRSIRLSPDMCYAWLRDERPIAMFGVATASLVSNKGVPWFLGTDEVYEDRMYWLRNSKIITKEMFKRYSSLENYVWAENTESIKWLKWCGFTMGDPVRYGKEQALFRRFWRINKDV